MLSAHQLECVRGERRLFSGLEFKVQPGTLLAVRGVNGSGKTSLLRILCGLSAADAGEVRWQGQRTQDVATVFRSALFYLGHGLSLKDELTALENLLSDAAVAGRAGRGVGLSASLPLSSSVGSKGERVCGVSATM